MTTRMSTSSERGLLRRHADAVAVLGVALVLRVGVVLATRNLTLRDDSADYVRLAGLLAHGHGFGDTVLAAGGGPTAFRAPAYPLFLGAVFRVTGDSLTAARLLQAGLGTVTVALIGIVAWQLWGRRTGIIAATLAAVYPPLILLGDAVQTESISLPLQMLVLALVLEHRRRADDRVVLPAACGALIGLCILTRPANIALVIPVVLLLATARTLRALLVPGAVVLGALLLTLAPWQVRNQSTFHRFVPVTTTDAFILAGVYNDQAAHDPHNRAVWRPPFVVPGLAELFTDPQLDEVELAEALREEGTEYAKEHPGYVAEVVATNIAHLFSVNGLARAETGHLSEGYGSGWSALWTISYWIVALLALGGMATRQARRVPLTWWLTPVLFVVVTVPTLGTARYRAPIEPFLVLLATLAIVALLDRWRRQDHDDANPGVAAARQP
jgi:4-amino-4-deoxy-L-arabinose transferase-like glycosyltransferase